MTKVSKKPIDPETFSHYVNNLWSAFILMDSKEDVRLLFKDLFTHTEYKMFAKRLEIARRLLEGYTYKSIQKDLNVTSNPVTRMNNVLNERGEGLRKVHIKLSEMEEGRRKKQKEYSDNLSNPFRLKAKRKTLGGALLKAGILALDKTISKKIKRQSVKKQLLV